MGGQVSKMLGKIFGTKEMRILMLGLDAAGKTSEFQLRGRLNGIAWKLTSVTRSYPLQTKAHESGCHHYSYCRFQR